MMYDLIICELCGQTFSTKFDVDICGKCNSLPSKPQRKTITHERSQIAKSYNVKALTTGSIRQKEWAEDIRAKYLLSCAKDRLSTYINSTSLLSSKFWIENRKNKNLEEDLLQLLEITTQLNNNAIEKDKMQKTLEQRALLLQKLTLTD